MRIGLTQRVLFHNEQAYDSLDHSWYEFFGEHTLFFIPNRLPVQLVDIDLLVITGGDDHPIRNQVEQTLIENQMLRNRPVLGVCHGAQLLTRLLGGSVVPCDNHQNCHHIVTYHDEQCLVNSYHKLCIERPPEGATVLACDPEGRCESWILNQVAAVMWHPERMARPWMPQEIEQLLGR